MDSTVLCGSPFTSIVYVTYNSSKVEKSSNICDFIQKIKKLDWDCDTKTLLRKVLINEDTCRSTGLPEAASNLLLYPHRFTSSKILRLDTRCYVPVDEEAENTTGPQSLNHLLLGSTRDRYDFELPDLPHAPMKPNTEKNFSIAPDSIAENYFNRPHMLYDSNENKIVSSANFSMTYYTENFKVTQKRKITYMRQSLDARNKFIQPRGN